MTSISCRQCGHASAREDHPDNQFRCPWCDWREVLPSRPRGKDAEAVAPIRDAENVTTPAADAAPTPATVPPPPPPPASLDPDTLQSLTPRAFVVWCADLLSRFGYAVTVPDEGEESDADLEIARDGTVTLVLCRGGADTDAVGRADCLQLVGAMAGRSTSRGMVITSGTFTQGAADYAGCLEGLTLELIDGDEVRATLAAMSTGPLRKWWGPLAPVVAERAAA